MSAVSAGLPVKSSNAAELPAAVTPSMSILRQFALTQIPCRTLPPAVQFVRWTPSIGLPASPARLSPALALLENQQSEKLIFRTPPVFALGTMSAPSPPQVSHSKLWMKELTTVWPEPGQILKALSA